MQKYFTDILYRKSFGVSNTIAAIKSWKQFEKKSNWHLSHILNYIIHCFYINTGTNI